MTEDEMVREHLQLREREFEQTLGDSEGRGRLVCCSPCVASSRTPLKRLSSNESLTSLPLIMKDNVAT